jgi:hypothetical protein
VRTCPTACACKVETCHAATTVPAVCRVAARYQQTGVGDPSGKLLGKAALRAYFQEALATVTNLKLDLQVSKSAASGHAQLSSATLLDAGHCGPAHFALAVSSMCCCSRPSY